MLLKNLIELSRQFDAEKVDATGKIKSFRFDQQANIIAPRDTAETLLSGQPLTGELTRHAFSQLCAKLGPVVYGKGSNRVLPADYLQAMPNDQRAYNLNRHLNGADPKKDWLVRFHGNTCRAILTGDYPGGMNDEGMFENTAYLTVIKQLLATSEKEFPQLRLVRPSITADNLNIRIMWRTISDTDGGYGAGVAVSNGETGQRRLRVGKLLQRHSCDNSIVHADEGMEFLHRGSLAALRTQFKAAIGKALAATQEMLDRMIAAEEEQLPDFAEVVANLAARHNWDNDIMYAVYAGSENRKTRAGLVHGITYAAHTEFANPNDIMDMEMLGGQYLYAELPRAREFFHR